MTGKTDVTVAAVAYGLERLPDFEAWRAKLADHVDRAVDRGAEIVVFPEYGLMELAGLFDDATAGHLQHSIDAIQPLIERARAAAGDLARARGVHILTASGPVRLEDGRTVNRAYLLTPDGGSDFQDKIVMTRFERDWGIVGNGPLKLFDTALGKIGVLICYDSEFPLLGRALVEAGAEILLVPSTTETLAGYHRVRIGASSRALEGQCVTVQAPLIGHAPWSEAVDRNQGRAAIYGPPDAGWPEDGVVAASTLNEPGMAVATVSREKIASTRADGGVLNRLHWDDQAIADGAPLAAPLRIETVRL